MSGIRKNWHSSPTVIPHGRFRLSQILLAFTEQPSEKITSPSMTAEVSPRACWMILVLAATAVALFSVLLFHMMKK